MRKSDKNGILKKEILECKIYINSCMDKFIFKKIWREK